jgi:hypothetical protein
MIPLKPGWFWEGLPKKRSKTRFFPLNQGGFFKAPVFGKAVPD